MHTYSFSFIFITLSLLCGSAHAHAQAQEYHGAEASQEQPAATLTAAVSDAQTAASMHIIDSPALHCTDTVLVYSPTLQAGERDLPTLFLLHGWSGCYRDWPEKTDLQKLSDEFGFRIICPDGFFDSWYINKVDKTQMRWRDFFWEELWPLMDSTYGLKSDRTFTDGLSMGGHGAMNLFLDHPELMRGGASMSGVLNLRSAGGSRSKIPEMLGAKSMDDPLCDAQSAVNRIGRVPERCGESASEKLMIVSCGLQDKAFLPACREFEQKADALGLKVIAVYSPARHRWGYWTWMLRYHLDWFRQAVDGGTLGDS